MVHHGSSEETIKSELFSYWERMSETYRSLIPRYLELIAEKRKKKLPLFKVSQETLKDFPKIELLELEEEQKAKKYIDGLSQSQAKEVLRVIKGLDSNYSFTTIKNAVCDSKAQLKRANDLRSYSLAQLPSSCGSSKKRAAPKKVPE